MAHALDVASTVELGGKNTRRADRTEDEKIEDEDELIDDGNARHSGGGDLTDHDVVEEVNKVRNAVLNYHRYGHGKYRAVKFLVTDIAAQKALFGHMYTSLNLYFNGSFK